VPTEQDRLWSVGRAYVQLSGTLEEFNAKSMLLLHQQLAILLGVDGECCLRLTVLGGSIIYQVDVHGVETDGMAAVQKLLDLFESNMLHTLANHKVELVSLDRPTATPSQAVPIGGLGAVPITVWSSVGPVRVDTHDTDDAKQIYHVEVLDASDQMIGIIQKHIDVKPGFTYRFDVNTDATSESTAQSLPPMRLFIGTSSSVFKMNDRACADLVPFGTSTSLLWSEPFLSSQSAVFTVPAGVESVDVGVAVRGSNDVGRKFSLRDSSLTGEHALALQQGGRVVSTLAAGTLLLSLGVPTLVLRQPGLLRSLQGRALALLQQLQCLVLFSCAAKSPVELLILGKSLHVWMLDFEVFRGPMQGSEQPVQSLITIVLSSTIAFGLLILMQLGAWLCSSYSHRSQQMFTLTDSARDASFDSLTAMSQRNVFSSTRRPPPVCCLTVGELKTRLSTVPRWLLWIMMASSAPLFNAGCLCLSASDSATQLLGATSLAACVVFLAYIGWTVFTLPQRSSGVRWRAFNIVELSRTDKHLASYGEWLPTLSSSFLDRCGGLFELLTDRRGSRMFVTISHAKMFTTAGLVALLAQSSGVVQGGALVAVHLSFLLIAVVQRPFNQILTNWVEIFTGIINCTAAVLLLHHTTQHCIATKGNTGLALLVLLCGSVVLHVAHHWYMLFKQLYSSWHKARRRYLRGVSVELGDSTSTASSSAASTPRSFISPKLAELEEAALLTRNQSAPGRPQWLSHRTPAKKTITINFDCGTLGMAYVGNVVTGVTPGTQADKLGVDVGWQIFSVNGTPMPNDDEIIHRHLSSVKQMQQQIEIIFDTASRQRVPPSTNDALATPMANWSVELMAKALTSSYVEDSNPFPPKQIDGNKPVPESAALSSFHFFDEDDQLYATPAKFCSSPTRYSTPPSSSSSSTFSSPEKGATHDRPAFAPRSASPSSTVGEYTHSDDTERIADMDYARHGDEGWTTYRSSSSRVESNGQGCAMPSPVIHEGGDGWTTYRSVNSQSLEKGTTHDRPAFAPRSASPSSTVGEYTHRDDTERIADMDYARHGDEGWTTYRSLSSSKDDQAMGRAVDAELSTLQILAAELAASAPIETTECNRPIMEIPPRQPKALCRDGFQHRSR
jgi:hypothetical protein